MNENELRDDWTIEDWRLEVAHLQNELHRETRLNISLYKKIDELLKELRELEDDYHNAVDSLAELDPVMFTEESGEVWN